MFAILINSNILFGIVKVFLFSNKLFVVIQFLALGGRIARPTLLQHVVRANMNNTCDVSHCGIAVMSQGCQYPSRYTAIHAAPTFYSKS